MIKLKGRYTQSIGVELDDEDVINAVIQLIRKKHNLLNVDNLDDKGRMVEHVEYATSHSWISTEDRGAPTKAQKKALEAIAELKALTRS